MAPLPSKHRAIFLCLICSGLLPIGFYPSSLQAQESDTVWTPSAQLRLRAESRINNHFRAESDQIAHKKPDNLDLISQRTRIGLKAQQGRISSFFQLQQGAIWGTTGGYTLNDAAVTLHQAWFEVAPRGWARFQSALCSKAWPSWS